MPDNSYIMDRCQKNVCDKEGRKADRYTCLTWEDNKLWSMEKVLITFIIIGVMETLR